MIFVTIGTHDQQFIRLLKHLDKIAPQIKEKIIVQRGFTEYKPKNFESFDFKPNLEEYYKKARIVLIHGASSVWEFAYKYKKPLIIVPRRKEYNEHINDHQVEFGQSFSLKTGVKTITDIKELTPELLKSYSIVPRLDKTNLINLQNFMKKLINLIQNE